MKYKNLVTIIVTVAFFVPLVHLVGAQYVSLSGSDIGLDESLDGELSEFVTPKSLVIVPLVPPSDSPDIDSLDWYKGMYYYQVTRFDLPAISFHYVITEDGKLIKNKFSESDRKIKFTDDRIEDPIVVAYLTKSGSLGFSPNAKGKVTSVITELVNKNSIPLENVFIKSIDFESGEDRSLNISLGSIFVGWENDLSRIIVDVSEKYVPVERLYSVNLVELTLPKSEIEVNKPFDVKLKLKNTGDFPVYADSDSELILNLLDEEATFSRFFYNDVWASQTQVKIMKPGEVLLPGEEKEFALQFNAPFDFGDVSEQFSIVNLLGNEFLSEPLTVAVQLQKPEGEFIQISDTETGYLNVRSNPGIGGEVVTKVSPGQRFQVLERQNGWIKIKVDDQTSGWISGKYSKIL